MPGRVSVHRLTAAIGSHGVALARDCLRRGEALVLDIDTLAEGHRLFTPDQATLLLNAMEAEGVVSFILTPLPADDGATGQLVLMRGNGLTWSPAERVAVHDMGRELGWAIGRERSRRREALATEALEQAARARLQLLTDLADEVAGPLAVIDGHLQSENLPETHPAQAAMEKFWGVFDQVTSLVAFENPDRTPRFVAIDVANLLLAHWSRLQDEAAANGVGLMPLESGGAQMAWADTEELEWLLGLLLVDLVHQATPGTSIRVVVGTPVDRLVISCQISPSEDPEAMTSHDSRRWWRSGLELVLAHQNGSLTERTGPGGRRAISLSLPVPPSVREAST
jgi:GAF domain-containing protein